MVYDEDIVEDDVSGWSGGMDRGSMIVWWLLVGRGKSELNMR